MQRIHRETRWYLQYLTQNLTSTKYFATMMMVAASCLPIMIVFQSLFGRFELISTVLTVIATIIGVYTIHQINHQREAPFVILSSVQAILYTVIGTVRWGINPAYYDFWGGLLSFGLSIVLVISILYLWLPTHSATDLPLSLGIIDYVGIALLTVGASIIRWYKLEEIPIATNIEALQSLYSSTMWHQATTNPIALTPDMQSQFISVLQGLSMLIFGETISGARHLSVIIGSISVITTFLATRMFFDTRTAWFTAIILLAMSSHIEFSRLVVPAIFDAMLVSAVLYAFASAWGSGKRRWYIGAGILLSLTQYSYHTGKIIPLVFAIWLCVYALQYWQDVESRLPQLSSMWGIALLGALPHWISIGQQFDTYRNTLSRISLFGTNEPMGPQWLTIIADSQQRPEWQVLLYNLRDAAAGFIAVPLRDQYEIGLAVLTIPAAIVFVLGIFIIAKSYADPRHWLLLIGLISAVSITAITINAPTAQRMIFMTPFVAIVVGIGIAEMGRWFKIDWIQHDWQINPIIIHTLSFGLAFAIAGYDGQGYLGTTRTALTNPVDQSITAISTQAKDYPDGSTIYLFTQPDLYYHESALLQFQLPKVTGVDVYPPLTSAPEWRLNNSTSLFVFSNDRINELEYLRQFYPGGTERRTYTPDGQILLVFYEVAGINTPNTP